MSQPALPDVLCSLIDSLHLVQLDWQGVPIQLPKFAIYAIIKQPVFDRVLSRKGKRYGLIQQGRYRIPVVDPFGGELTEPPKYAVIVSMTKDNRFGLFAYPADHVRTDAQIPLSHGAVRRIVKDFV